jgi:hypothetical protein
MYGSLQLGLGGFGEFLGAFLADSVHPEKFCNNFTVAVI